MRPNLSIVIPTHGSAERPLRLVEHLATQLRSEQNAEVLIVSNSQNTTLNLALQKLQPSLPFSLFHLTGSAIGSNRARNLGMRAARAEIVLLLDDDCLPINSEFFDKVQASHADSPDYTAIGGGYLSTPESTESGRIYNWISNDWLGAQFEKTEPTSRLIGGCVSYKLDRLRLEDLWFDDNIIYGGAETEFHERLLRAGHKLLFNHQLWIQHDCQISARDLWKKAVLQGYGKARRTLLSSHTPSPATFWRKFFRDKREYHLYRLGFFYGEHLGRAGRYPQFENRWSRFIFNTHLILAPPSFGIISESNKSSYFSKSLDSLTNFTRRIPIVGRILARYLRLTRGYLRFGISRIYRVYYWWWRNSFIVRKAFWNTMINTKRLNTRLYWIAYHLAHESIGHLNRMTGLAKKYLVIGFWSAWEVTPQPLRTFARIVLRRKND